MQVRRCCRYVVGRNAKGGVRECRYVGVASALQRSEPGIDPSRKSRRMLRNGIIDWLSPVTDVLPKLQDKRFYEGALRYARPKGWPVNVGPRNSSRGARFYCHCRCFRRLAGNRRSSTDHHMTVDPAALLRPLPRVRRV